MTDRWHRRVCEGWVEAEAAALPHWTCPDCGEACRCSDDLARQLKHERCGLAGRRNDAATEVTAPRLPNAREGDASIPAGSS